MKAKLVANLSMSRSWLAAFRKARMNAGMSLKDAGDDVSLSGSALCRIETGERSCKVWILERLCSHYGVLPWEVLRGLVREGEFAIPGTPPCERLREARKRTGYTLAKAAELLGVSQPSLSLIENGHRRLTTSLLKRALDTLNRSYEEYFTGADGKILFERNVTGAAAAGRSQEAVYWGEFPGLATAIGPRGAARDLIVLEIEGVSMEPYLLEGDMVFCDPETEASVGDLVVAQFEDGSMVCKRYEGAVDGKLHLHSVNVASDDLYVRMESLAGLWPVMGSYRREH
ncbi:MAG: helix-turn-helix domain-containing protein [Planctomycetota bacterium]|nr:helix-turn-helix domain-containing protein [Planctomycetota bacterium]